ncbi:MAG: SRPBCC family protein [Acidimicrobiales bacterium]
MSDAPDSLRIRAHLGAPPSAMFKTLTDADSLTAWLAERADVTLGDHRYEFWGRTTPGDDRHRQRLLDAERDARLRFAWPIGDRETEVDIRLASDGGSGTILDLSHAGAPTWDEVMSGSDNVFVHDFWRLSLANLDNFLTGRRLVPAGDLSTRGLTEARVELDIDAAPDDVFSYLVEPEKLNRWMDWVPPDAVVDLRVGGRISVGEGEAPMEILDLVPGRRLAYSLPLSPDGPPTMIRWELDGSQGRTHLTFVHSGFGPDQTADQFQVGWRAYLAELKRLIEFGADWRPFEVELPGQPVAG